MLQSKRKNKEAELKMKLLILSTLFGTLQVVTGTSRTLAVITTNFDTSNYLIIKDGRSQNFSYYAEKCRGEVNFKIYLYGGLLHMIFTNWSYNIDDRGPFHHTTMVFD